MEPPAPFLAKLAGREVDFVLRTRADTRWGAFETLAGTLAFAAIGVAVLLAGRGWWRLLGLPVAGYGAFSFATVLRELRAPAVWYAGTDAGLVRMGAGEPATIPRRRGRARACASGPRGDERSTRGGRRPRHVHGRGGRFDGCAWTSTAASRGPRATTPGEGGKGSRWHALDRSSWRSRWS